LVGRRLGGGRTREIDSQRKGSPFAWFSVGRKTALGTRLALKKGKEKGARFKRGKRIPFPS